MKTLKRFEANELKDYVLVNNFQCIIHAIKIQGDNAVFWLFSFESSRVRVF